MIFSARGRPTLRSFFFLGALLLGLSAARPALAATAAPAPTAPPPAAWVLVLRDLPRETSIATVAAYPDSHFRAYNPAEAFAQVQRRPGQPPAWLRLTLPSAGPVARTAFLEIGTGYEDDVDLFQPDGRGGWSVLRAGEGTAPADRAWPALRNILPVVLPATGAPPVVVHVRVAEVFGPLWTVRLHADAAAFATRQQNEVAQNFAYFGCLIALFAYNLFLYVRLGYRDLLFYLLYLVTFGAVMLYGTNTNALLFPTAPGHREVLVLALLNASIAAFLLFVREYHGLAACSRRLSRFVLGLAVLFTLGIAQYWSTPLSPLGTYAYFGNLFLALATFLVIPVVSILAWRRGARQARYFLVAFGFLLGSLFLMLAGYLGFVWFAGAETPLIRAGSAIEMILLSLAIGDRFRRLRDEKAALQAQYTARLEADVAARTAALALADAQKDRLFAVIGHDLRGPLGAIALNAAHLARPTPAPDAAATATDIQASARSLSVLLDTLLDWSRLQTGTARTNPENFPAADLAAELRELLAPVARQRGVAFECSFDAGASAGTLRSDRAMLATVLRNLAANALKAATRRVAVAVEHRADGTVAFSVTDDGPGLAPEKIATLGLQRGAPHLADPPQRGHGHVVCREFAALLGAELWAESAPTRGTTVHLLLPAGEDAGSNRR
jgi:signal transduction histidine kinase